MDPTEFLKHKGPLRIDLKDGKSLNSGGVELIRTQYFLKKDFYAFVISSKMDSILMCNVNERIVLSNP